MAKSRALPFDKRGGVIAIQRRMLDSKRYLELSAQGKALMVLLQTHWRPDRPVAFGIREAAQKIPCARAKAMAVFEELQAAGFIVKIDESIFDSRTTSRSRTWCLTWLPYNGKMPTNGWEENESTGSKMTPAPLSEVSKIDR